MKLKDGQELTLRKAEKADAANILAYLNQVGGESDNLLFGKDGMQMPVEAEEEFIESTNGCKTSVLLVGLVENEVACVGSISASSRERIAHLGEVAVSVAKKYWRLGIGEALMKELIAFARQTGKLKTLYLGVRDGNGGAVALYRKLGFAEYGRFPGFFHIYGQFQDEILMYKEI
ncbi:MAG TPA: GNAT family N-acetyltransferase [Candidatus Gallacutalibacter pullistercoris]|nr:GNAT family N-acetyltransferase [Candidatus Gallacutalibacter pullistercoris]